MYRVGAIIFARIKSKLIRLVSNFNDIADGRRSFPSGHSSTIFSGMAFLSLFLSAQTAAWSFSTPIAAGKPWAVQSRLLRITVTLLPLAFATWVAVSRVEDYVSSIRLFEYSVFKQILKRHNKEDVIVGSLIGIFTSFVGYLSYWRSPFSEQHHARGLAHIPRLLYKEDVDDDPQRSVVYDNIELSRLEEGIE